MVRTASLANCWELYGLSGWPEESAGDWYEVGGIRVPAYTVNTLIGYLPAHELIKRGDTTWRAVWVGDVNGVTRIEGASRSNPANALARLAAELFRWGVLLSAADKG